MGYKAKSITSKASSACKMNMALVKGEAKIGAVKKAGIGDLQASFDAGIKNDEDPSPLEMKSSPAKIDPVTIAKVAPMVMGALGGGKKGGGGANTTKVVVNNSADASSQSNSQAANAIDPK
jgi:hypothetical protein